MIRLVVFDMAGTTVDEDNVVYKTIQSAIAEDGFPVTLDTVLAYGAGKEKLQAIKDILFYLNGEVDFDTALNIHTAFRKKLVKAYEELDVKPISGAEQVFAALRNNGVKVALNTGYDRKTALGLMEKLGWKEGVTVDALVSASDVMNNRPEPDMVLLAMVKTGIKDPSSVIKVGDSAIDVEEGRNAGCLLNIGITGGAQTRAQLMEASPDHIIDRLSELLGIVESQNTMAD